MGMVYIQNCTDDIRYDTWPQGWMVAPRGGRGGEGARSGGERRHAAPSLDGWMDTTTPQSGVGVAWCKKDLQSSFEDGTSRST